MRDADAPPAAENPVETISILAWELRQSRLTVVLDRDCRKRCDFVFTGKPSKKRPNELTEQIWWMTQTFLNNHEEYGSYVAQWPTRDYTVQIDCAERAPWRFPEAIEKRARLPAGDYALIYEGKVAAVVERKSLKNLLQDLESTAILHQRCADLCRYEQNAFVVESPYEHLLQPKKVDPWTPSFCTTVIADLYSAHPRLRLVFCSTRTTANQWTINYFRSVLRFLKTRKDPTLGPVLTAPMKIERERRSEQSPTEGSVADGSIELVLPFPAPLGPSARSTIERKGTQGG